jgi:hypothetical protein
MSGTIQASAVHVVSAETSGAERFKMFDATVHRYDGALTLRRATADGLLGDEPLTVVGTGDEIVELLKADQPGSGVWLLVDSAAAPTLPAP